MNLLKLISIFLFFVPALSLAQTSEREGVIEEFVKRFNNGNDDIVELYCDKNANRKEARALVEKLGKISDRRLIEKGDNSFLYEVKLSYAGPAKLKIVFKGNLIKKYALEPTKEYQIRAETDELIWNSIDTLHAAFMALDTDKAFKEINQIEKLYRTGKSSRDDDAKHRLKLMWAELYAMSGNESEALRLLSELKEERPVYAEKAKYDCYFASLQSKPEFIRITGDSLELYFALAKPVDDSIKICLDTNRFDDALKYLDIKDSLYTTLTTDDRDKVSYSHAILDRYRKIAAYSMKGNIDEAIRLLQEKKDNDWVNAIYEAINIDTTYFKNLKQTNEYQTLTSSMKCNCGEVFDWVATKIEGNDAGFDYTIEMKGKDTYEKLTAEKRAESKSINSTHECVKFVNDWLKFFRKSHIGFFLNQPIFADTINTYDKFAIKKLSKNTMYVKIKSFMGNNSQQIISAMLDANEYLLSNTPNLIIDLRGNSGGLLNAWNILRKYIDSKPVHSYDDMVRLGDEFVKRAMDANPNINRNDIDKRFFGNDTSTTVTNPDEIQKYPENIVILVDETTGSSSEFFLIYAKQSNKVKVMGQKTYGATDIGIGLIESPSKQFLLEYGIFINSQAKYTQYIDYGIQPDIFLRKDYDWIEEARKYLEY